MILQVILKKGLRFLCGRNKSVKIPKLPYSSIACLFISGAKLGTLKYSILLSALDREKFKDGNLRETANLLGNKKEVQRTSDLRNSGQTGEAKGEKMTEEPITAPAFPQGKIL